MTFEPLILEHSDYYVYKDFSSFDVSVPLVVQYEPESYGRGRSKKKLLHHTLK